MLSFFKKKEKGEANNLIEHPKEIENLSVEHFIEEDFETAHPELTAGEVTEILRESEMDEIPVIDSGDILGMIRQEDILNIEEIRSAVEEGDRGDMISHFKRKVKDINKTDVTVSKDEDIFNVLIKMERNGLDSIPVTDESDNVLGILHKSNIIEELWKSLP